MSKRHIKPFIVLGTKNVAAPLDSSAAVSLADKNKGFLTNRLTTVERDAIDSPAEGLLIYNLDAQRLEFWDGESWGPLASGSDFINLILESGNYIAFDGAGAAHTWRMGYHMCPFSTHSIGLFDTLKIAIGTATNEGFAVGQYNGNSIFELRGADGAAWFAGDVAIEGGMTAKRLEMNQVPTYTGEELIPGGHLDSDPLDSGWVFESGVSFANGIVTSTTGGGELTPRFSIPIETTAGETYAIEIDQTITGDLTLIYCDNNNFSISTGMDQAFLIFLADYTGVENLWIDFERANPGATRTITRISMRRIDPNSINIFFIGDPRGKTYAKLGTRSLILGQDAGQGVSGVDTVIMGPEAGQGARNTDAAIAIGSHAGQGATNFTSAIAIGNMAAHAAYASGSIAIGNHALYRAGGTAVALGEYAGANQSGNNTIILGLQAGQENTGHRLVAIGPSAGRLNTGADVIAIGDSAAIGNTGDGVIIIGARLTEENTIANLLNLGGELVGVMGNNDPSNPPTFQYDLRILGALRATSAAPNSATAEGKTGTVTWDDDFVYVCTATNTWKRAALSTW